MRNRLSKTQNEAFRLNSTLKFKEKSKVNFTEFNKSVQVQEFTISSDNKTPKEVTVFRDDKVLGGTKIRALVEWFQSLDQQKTLIYACSAKSYSQVSFVVACAHLKINARLYVSGVIIKSTNSNLAKRYNRGKFVLIEPVTKQDSEGNIVPGGLSTSLKVAKEYYDKNKDNSILIELGFDNVMFKSILTNNLKSGFDKYLGDSVKRMFLVVGTGTLLTCFATAFPYLSFVIVTIGKLFDIASLPLSITSRCVIVGNVSYYSHSNIKPPFPSSKLMDAKLWSFVLEHSITGDTVLNVARS